MDWPTAVVIVALVVLLLGGLWIAAHYSQPRIRYTITTEEAEPNIYSIETRHCVRTDPHPPHVWRNTGPADSIGLTDPTYRCYGLEVTTDHR